MADFDVVADTLPQQEYRPTRNYGRKTIDELKTEIRSSTQLRTRTPRS